MGLLNLGLRIVMDIAVTLPIAQPLHQPRHSIPKMDWNPKITMGLGILHRFQ